MLNLERGPRFRRIRHSAVGTREERIEWRMAIIGVLFVLLSLATFSTSPTALHLSNSVAQSFKSVSRPIRNLMSVKGVEFDGLNVGGDEIGRRLDAAECFAEHPDQCGDPNDGK